MGCYNQPIVSNFEGIDSLVPSLGIVFQMTTSAKHDLKYNKLDEIRKSGVSYSSNQGQSNDAQSPTEMYSFPPHGLLTGSPHPHKYLRKRPEIHISNRRENMHGFHPRGIPSERNKIYVNSLLYTWVLDSDLGKLG
jgi:hypothetical protein